MSTQTELPEELRRGIRDAEHATYLLLTELDPVLSTELLARLTAALEGEREARAATSRWYHDQFTPASAVTATDGTRPPPGEDGRT